MVLPVLCRIPILCMAATSILSGVGGRGAKGVIVSHTPESVAAFNKAQLTEWITATFELEQ